MDKNTAIGTVSLVVIAVIVGFLVLRAPTPALAPTIAPSSDQSAQPIATVTYSCDAGQAIAAAYYDGPSTLPADPSQPPTPGGSVVLVLSDGRTMTLPQTISADGARYANADESFVFWSKGNGAIVEENGQESSFTNCIEAASSTPANS